MSADKENRAAVLSIGRIYCDMIFTGLDALPQLGRETFAKGLAITAGGGVFITAAHLVHAGRQAMPVARLGLDPLSREVERELEASGCDLRFLERGVEAGPQVTVAAVVGSERAFLSRRAGGAAPATLEVALDWPQARHLHIAEYATLAEIPGLVARAKARGLTVSLDPSWDETLIFDPALPEKCAGVDLFLPNAEEAAAMTGSRDPAEALGVLAQHFPLVALKAGGAGAWLAVAGEILHAPARSVPVIDTTGAGDAFNAGFIDAWLKGAAPRACLEAGIASGSLAVQSPGATSVYRR